jgi:cell division protein FtsI/penicillin-binding protein 2
MTKDYAASGASLSGAVFSALSRRSRLAIIGSATVVWVGVVIARLVSLQISASNRWQDWAVRQHLSEIMVASERGPIYDRSDKLMAVSVPAGSIYVRPKQPIAEAAVMQLLRDAYAGERFVRVVDHLPATKDTVDTNYCDITARVVRGRVLLISCLDNLVKGAAGAAVQNYNCVFGLPETAGLP